MPSESYLKPVFPAGAPSAYVVRTAGAHDAVAIQSLLAGFGREGLLLSRTLDEIYSHLTDFEVVEGPNGLLGCGSLRIYGPELAEIRSLAVSKEFQGRGLGRRLVASLLAQAGRLEIKRVFALTFQRDFFRKVGFEPIEKEHLPQKIWYDCVGCPHFPDCREEAFITVQND